MSRHFLGALAALVLVSCQPKPSRPTAREISSVVIVADSSTSSGDMSATTVKTLRCPEVVGSIRQVLTPSTRILDVLVLASGGKGTSSEPRVLVPWIRYQPAVRLFGKTPSKEAQEQTFLKTIEERCYSALKEENSSPIVAAISRGALSLASHCKEIAQRREVCSSQQLLILSDLRENVDPHITTRLRLVSEAIRRQKALSPQPSTLPTISLGHITISICGLGEHVQGADDVRVSPEALLIVWREILGTTPTINAACPRGLPHVAPVQVKQGGAR